MGFLTAPEGETGRSRIALLEAANMPVPLPRVEDEALIGLAAALGWCGVGAIGPVPLSAQEIMAWCAGTGERLTHWEFATLRAMSTAYVAGTCAKAAPFEGMTVRMALATASFKDQSAGAAKTSRR